ncbi:MAG TPA: sulfite reductase [Gammaproteobacteria bacterium]|nr:sulfite reductase [Gammaproteobacteria bacterium]
MNAPDPKTLNDVEQIKARSRHLRGTIADGLVDPLTGAIAPDDNAVLKFHGSYQQDDRDLREERRRQKLEPAYQFMIRVRLPGGECTPAQWLALDDIAGAHANGTLRLTTRQTFQFHGIRKPHFKPAMQAIHAAGLDTIAACGDVNRNVLASANPYRSPLHAAAGALARAVSEHLLPRTNAYAEIWLDAPAVDPGTEVEPVYGPLYLPRKFKIGIAVPPDNDVDVYAQDLSFIAVEDGGQLVGWNVLVGGGMGMTHGEKATYPRLADVLGFCTPEQALAVAEQVVCVQRDFGDRTNRRHARLKYTIDDRGVDWFKAELENRLGFALAPARPFAFERNTDAFGWHEGPDGRWHYTLFVENGRVADRGARRLRTGLREIARVHRGLFALTNNQNVTIAGVEAARRAAIATLIDEYGLEREASRLRQNAMACVAMPSCALAMAESERYLPDLITRLDGVIDACGLADTPITLRMTGCPNGCARPYLAEIALVGKAPGHYSLFLGGDSLGRRLNREVLDNADEAQILAELDGWFGRFAAERRAEESFGDFAARHLLPAGEAA